MCEIQFVMSNTLGNDNVNNFIEMLRKGSKSNDDATGIFSDAYQWKVGKAYDDLKDKKDGSMKHILSELPSNWLVGHNRLATQGSENDNENNHPFSNDTCTVVHNGIISNDDDLKTQFGFNYKAETDSAIIPALVDYHVRNGKDELDAIKDSIEEIRGSYSIFVYMHDSQNLYYLKNSSTSFYMMKAIDDNDIVSIYGSTSKSSLEDMSYIKSDGFFGADLFKARNITSPDSGIIYRIVYKGDELDIANAGEFTPASYVYSGGVTYYGNGGWKGAYGGAYTNGVYDWDSLDDDDYSTGSAVSHNEAKRVERKESKEAMAGLMKDVDANVDEIFENVVDDIENVGFYGEDLDADGTLTNAVMESISVYSDRHQQIVIRDLPTKYGDYLESWLDATAWSTTDDIAGPDVSNYTVKYQSIIDYVEANQ